MNLPAAPLSERPAVDTPPGAPAPEAPPGDVFAALLNIQTARTAPAEGQTTTAPPDGTVLDELAATLGLPVPAPPTPAKGTPAKATPAVPAVPAHVAAPDGAPAPAKEQRTKAHDAPRAQPATPAVPAHDPMQTREVVKTPGKPTSKEPVAKAPAKAPVARVAQDRQPATAPSNAPADGTAIKDAAPVKERPPVQGTPEQRPVLRGERIEALVRLATRHGSAEARMELHPQELGSVVVRLRVTSDGLQATFTASNPEAMAQLQQAGDDLRRSLEAKGLTLATLDVRAQGDDAGRPGERRGWAGHKDRRPADLLDDEPLTVTTSTPAGELVDVQA